MKSAKTKKEDSPDDKKYDISSKVVMISEALISGISGFHLSEFKRLEALDLHLRGNGRGRIARIENLHLIPNLKQLNLSFNAISIIEGLEPVDGLLELNLAENKLSRV